MRGRISDVFRLFCRSLVCPLVATREVGVVAAARSGRRENDAQRRSFAPFASTALGLPGYSFAGLLASVSSITVVPKESNVVYESTSAGQ